MNLYVIVRDRDYGYEGSQADPIAVLDDRASAEALAARMQAQSDPFHVAIERARSQGLFGTVSGAEYTIRRGAVLAALIAEMKMLDASEFAARGACDEVTYVVVEVPRRTCDV